MEFYVPNNIGNVIIPTDFHSIIFQRNWNHQPVFMLTKNAEPINDVNEIYITRETTNEGN